MPLIPVMPPKTCPRPRPGTGMQAMPPIIAVVGRVANLPHIFVPGGAPEDVPTLQPAVACISALIVKGRESWYNKRRLAGRNDQPDPGRR